jgi:iron(III) transport system substrate-binding protein
VLSLEVEAALVNGPGAMIPVMKGDHAKPRVETPESVRPMDVDYAQAAFAWDRATEFFAAELREVRGP